MPSIIHCLVCVVCNVIRNYLPSEGHYVPNTSLKLLRGDCMKKHGYFSNFFEFASPASTAK